MDRNRAFLEADLASLNHAIDTLPVGESIERPGLVYRRNKIAAELEHLILIDSLVGYRDHDGLDRGYCLGEPAPIIEPDPFAHTGPWWHRLHLVNTDTLKIKRLKLLYLVPAAILAIPINLMFSIVENLVGEARELYTVIRDAITGRL